MKKLFILLFIGCMSMVAVAQTGFYYYYGEPQVLYPGQIATIELRFDCEAPVQITYARNGEHVTKTEILSSPYYWGEIIQETTTFTLLDIKNRFGDKIKIDPNHTTIVVKVVGTGVEENDENSFSIHPNPATSTVTIDSEIPITRVDIYTIESILKKSVVLQNTTIEISDLSSGVYLLKLFSEEDTVFIRKIIKQ